MGYYFFVFVMTYRWRFLGGLATNHLTEYFNFNMTNKYKTESADISLIILVDYGFLMIIM